MGASFPASSTILTRTPSMGGPTVPRRTARTDVDGGHGVVSVRPQAFDDRHADGASKAAATAAESGAAPETASRDPAETPNSAGPGGLAVLWPRARARRKPAARPRTGSRRVAPHRLEPGLGRGDRGETTPWSSQAQGTRTMPVQAKLWNMGRMQSPTSRAVEAHGEGGLAVGHEVAVREHHALWESRSCPEV